MKVAIIVIAIILTLPGRLALQRAPEAPPGIPAAASQNRLPIRRAFNFSVGCASQRKHAAGHQCACPARHFLGC